MSSYPLSTIGGQNLHRRSQWNPSKRINSNEYDNSPLNQNNSKSSLKVKQLLYQEVSEYETKCPTNRNNQSEDLNAMEIRSANVLSYRDNSRDEIDRCMIRKNFADMCKEVTQFKKNGKRQKPQNNNNKHKRCKTSLK